MLVTFHSFYPCSKNTSALSVSPVGFREQDRHIGLADEVLIGHLADGGDLFLPAGQGLQIEGGLDFGPQHAQVRGQQVDEDLRGESEQLTEVFLKMLGLSTFLKV